MAQEALLLNTSKELNTVKETIYQASPTPAGCTELARRSHFIP